VDLEYINQVVRLVRQARITELTLRQEGQRLTVRKRPVPWPVPAPARGEAGVQAWPPLLSDVQIQEIQEGPRTILIKSHLVGVFHRGAERGGEPLVAVGTEVTEGQTVGMIESMRKLVEVTTPVRGTVVGIFVQDGEPVEYGQALVEVEMDGA